MVNLGRKTRLLSHWRYETPEALQTVLDMAPCVL